ncbi:MAG TPA: Ig-like domain repeat protein, partial [Anaeromyxobacteraceae bacterium]
MLTTRHAWPLVLAGVLAACSAKAPPPAAAPAPAAARAPHRSTAAFTNGDFETGSLAPWVKSTYLNRGLAAGGNPTTRAELQLQAGGVDKTKIISGPTETVSALGLNPGELLVPKYGNSAAVVNELGASNNVNGISQQMTVTNADVDPADGKVHIRFALAPVLQNPNHAATDQPYFWAELKNVTRSNVTLFYTFNYSNQGGVPWKTSGTGTLYTDWQSFDISPGNAQLAVGDTVELEVIAGGCAQGGHYGHVYVDGIGAFLPGLSVAAAAPSSVNTGSLLTYTLNYRNGGTGAGANVTIEETLPAGTTFASLSAPGATCTFPAVGAAGVVSCNVGSLNPAASSSLQVTVNVTAGAGSTIANGNYRIWADGVSPLIGPLVQTTVTSNATYADLAITMTDGVAALTWGQADAYTVVATNNGPSDVTGATVTDVLPAQFTGATWTCAAVGGASCGAANGSGDLHQTVDLPVGGSVIYLVSGDVVAGSGAGSLVNTAAIAPPALVTDNVPANDTAVDTDAIGSLYTLTVQKDGSGAGAVVSSPAAISCGGGCPSQAASFLDGTQVVLTASAGPGDTFTGWSGGGCSGTGATCAVTVTAATSVAASFSSPAPTTFNVTASAVGSGTITCDSPVSSGASSTCTLAPATQQYLSHLTDDGADVTASVPGGAYVIPIVTADHVIVATFSISTTATALSTDAAAPVRGQLVTLTADVRALAPAGTPSGTVSFTDGATVLCAAQPVSGGQATCATSSLAVGAHAFTATSSGDASYNGSASAALPLTVGHAGTTTTLAASPTPSVAGQPVTLTATLAVVGPGAGAPTGTVSFSDGGAVLCAAQPVSGGQATCSLASLPVGAHGVIATYSGDGSFSGSASAASSQSVGKDTSSLTVASSRNPSRRGRPVVFTATLSAPHAALAGAVTFKDGETVLGQAAFQQGQATLTTRGLAKGTHAITAVYDGSTDLVAASATLAGGEVVENTPPVAGAGSALDLGPAAATRASVADPAGALALTTGTVELWARPGWTSPSGVTGTPGLFRIGPTDAPRLAADVSSDRKALVVRMGSNAMSIPAPLDDGGWHHLALVADGTQVVAWMDGAALGTAQGSPQAGSSTDLTLGDSFTGQLDEVRVWSKIRTGEELGAAMRRPLAGDEAGLAGYWRMDEGSGAELFDASSSHLDAAVAVVQGGQAFVPSLAWRARTAWEERDLEPVAAGYDADGDALTLTIASSPSKGEATVDQARLEVRYHAGQKQLGADRIGFALDDGEAKSQYTVEVALERILVCQANASCGGGDLCVQGACVAPSELDARSGSDGCATGGGVTPS